MNCTYRLVFIDDEFQTKRHRAKVTPIVDALKRIYAVRASP
jgi:hypothetical protein